MATTTNFMENARTGMMRKTFVRGKVAILPSSGIKEPGMLLEDLCLMDGLVSLINGKRVDGKLLSKEMLLTLHGTEANPIMLEMKIAQFNILTNYGMT